MAQKEGRQDWEREGGQLCVIILSNRVVRQYRACVVDLLGLGIHVWCVLLYYAYNPSRNTKFCACMYSGY